MIAIAILVIVFALAGYAGYVLRAVAAAAERFDQRSREVFAAEKLLFEQQLSALKETSSLCTFQMIRAMSDVREAHAAALQGMADTHSDAMERVNESHGRAADLLASTTAAHHQAAGANAEAVAQLREAAEQINSVVSNSDTFEIKQHVHALRNFFLPKQG